MRAVLDWILGYTWIVLLVGLGILGFAGYTVYSAGKGGKIPPETELTTIVGDVQNAREMTVERRRRRGGTSKSKHYEIDVKPATGEMLKVRVDYIVSRSVIQTALDAKKVTVKYDSNDDNTVYVIVADDKTALSYETSAKYSQATADSNKDFATGGIVLGAGFIATALGIGGIVLRRRLRASDEAASA